MLREHYSFLNNQSLLLSRSLSSEHYYPLPPFGNFNGGMLVASVTSFRLSDIIYTSDYPRFCCSIKENLGSVSVIWYTPVTARGNDYKLWGIKRGGIHSHVEICGSEATPPQNLNFYFLFSLHVRFELPRKDTNYFLYQMNTQIFR